MSRLDKSVGGDPYLTTLRASVYLEQGRYEESKILLERSIKDEPLVSAYWGMINLSLKQKKYADTLAWLKKIVEKFQIEVADLTEMPDYADFVKTSEYRTWVKWLASKKK